MTTLEMILIGIIWISYGIFVAAQEEVEDYTPLVILFSPIILVIRAFVGIFTKLNK